MSSGVEISKRILAINSAGTVVRALLSVSVLFWMHQHLIRRLPQEEYVLLPVLMAVIAITPLISTVLAGGLARFVIEAHAKNEERRVTEITSTMAPLTLLAGVVVAVVGLLFTWKIDVFLEIAPSQVANAQVMFVIMTAGAAVRTAALPFGLGFVVRQKYVLRDLIGFGAEMLRLGLLVYLLTEHETRVLWVPVAAFSSNIVELVITTAWSRRLLPAARFERSAIRREVIRPIVGFGSWTILGQVSRLVREMADPLILNRLALPGDVVAFNLGAQIDRHARRTLFGAIAVAQPATTAMVATDQMDRLRRAWFRLCRYSLWAMLAVAVPFIVLREEFFELYLREKFEANREAPIVLALLLGRYLAVFPNAAIGLVTVARAKLRVSSLQSVGLEITNLVLTLILVGACQMGAVGSALSTFVVAMVGHPLLVWRLGLRLTGAKFGEWCRVSVFPGVVPCVVTLPLWLVLRQTVQPETWGSLAWCGIAGWFAYAVIVLLLTKPDERRVLRKALGLARDTG